MDADITVESVKAVESRSGNTRYVVRDTDGREYTTFRPKIGKEAAGYEGRRAGLSDHSALVVDLAAAGTPQAWTPRSRSRA